MKNFYLKSKKLTLETAKLMACAARKEAERLGVPGAIAIVDDGGNLMYLERLDHTMIAASKLAISKASTAVAFKRPTKNIEDVILEGRTPMLSLGNVLEYVPLMGGYPIWHQNEVIGGVAVAGTLKAEIDELVVLAAISLFDEEKYPFESVS